MVAFRGAGVDLMYHDIVDVTILGYLDEWRLWHIRLISDRPLVCEKFLVSRNINRSINTCTMQVNKHCRYNIDSRG